MITTYDILRTPAGGGTFDYEPTGAIQTLYIGATNNPLTLLADVIVNFTGTIAEGTIVSCIVYGNPIALNGFSFTLNSVVLTQEQMNKRGTFDFIYLDGVWTYTYNKSWIPITGVVTTNEGNVTTFTAGSIVNADVNAAAGITRSKLAAGTASHVLINSGAGVMTSEAYLAASRGGLAIDTSGATGFPSVAAGTWSVNTLTGLNTLDVSFETGEVGDFKIKMPFAGTVTEIYAYCYKAIAATDNGTITPKNNAGTTMTSGTITFTASDARGTAYTSTPSANNTFVAGDLITFTTAKATAGGKVMLSIKTTRNS